MLGIVAIGLTAFMIFTLVKNALVGTQLSSHDRYAATIELIIPITAHSEFYLEPWIQNLSHFHSLSGNLKIHILIDGHHPSVNAWQELHQRLPFVELHSFLMRPLGRAAVPWMMEQIAPKITGSIVIIGDAELVPTENAFMSLSHMVSEKDRPVFVLPQTAKTTILGEAIALINPTLALTSVFGFKKMRQRISHPLIGISQGWMGMNLATFKAFDWTKVNISSWKEALSKEWHLEKKSYVLAFGEKHLLRYYPEVLKVHIHQMQYSWSDLWNKGDRAGLWLYLTALVIWSFPILCLLTHPFWAMASIILLVLYRFFTKIVFQESWLAAILHPFGCVMWLGTFFWWLWASFQSRYGTKRTA